MAREDEEGSAGGLCARVATSLAAVDAAAWDACANPVGGVDGADRHNPAISHAFLLALEASGCVGGRTGWGPAHLLVEDAAGALVACAPAYVKSHSMGEYVFDHAWADAFERAGGSYYPKVQVAVPFTPTTGRRLLVRPGPGAAAARDALVAGLEALRARLDASSVHVTFALEDEVRALDAKGFLVRTDQQFHWLNEGYGTYEDFLGALASRKRKALRRERREALAGGVSIERVTGADLRPAHWDAFHAFYADTADRKWGRPYLNRAFFRRLGEAMPDRVMLVLARREGRYVAGALNLVGDDALYGRHWGCLEEHPFLHFEVCYHQAIEFAIERGLQRVEAGAQGEHKLARGYRPVATHSAHAIAHPGLSRAVADYLERERGANAELLEVLGEHAPFRRGAVNGGPSVPRIGVLGEAPEVDA